MLFIAESVMYVLPGYEFIVKTTLLISNNDVRIAGILIHCGINSIRCEINNVRVAWMLVQHKNNTIHCKIKDIRIAWILIYCKNQYGGYYCDANSL